MSEVYVSWGKLVDFGWKIGGGLILVSQALTALQLENSSLKMQQSIKDMDKKHENNFKAVRESIQAIDDKLEKLLPKKR